MFGLIDQWEEFISWMPRNRPSKNDEEYLEDEEDDIWVEDEAEEEDELSDSDVTSDDNIYSSSEESEDEETGFYSDENMWDFSHSLNSANDIYSLNYFNEEEVTEGTDQIFTPLIRETFLQPEEVGKVVDSALHHILPQIDPPSQQQSQPQEVSSHLSNSRVKMTDLGFQISKLILQKSGQKTNEVHEHDNDESSSSFAFNQRNEEEEEVDEVKDVFLEKTLQGRKRNRTGVRGRPKGVDYGFGKSTTHTLPFEAGKLMGKANMAYVSRKYDEAISLLLEVIRQCPHAAEAYQTLGMIHEEREEWSKAMSYFVIASQLHRHDTDLWLKIANLALRLHKFAEAIFFLSKLISLKDASNDYFWIRARLLVQRGDLKRAVIGFKRLLISSFNRPAIEAQNIFNQIDTLSVRLHEEHSFGEMLSEVVADAIVKHNYIPSLEILSIYFDRMYKECKYKTATGAEKIANLLNSTTIPVALKHYSHSIPAAFYGWGPREQTIWSLSLLPSNLRLIHSICEVKSAPSSSSTSLTTSLKWVETVDRHVYNYLLKDLGIVLLKKARPSDALAILLSLVSVYPVADADLSFIIGECYRLLPGMEDLAIASFERVVEMSPERGDARLALSDLYRLKGDGEKAKSILQQQRSDQSIIWPDLSHSTRQTTEYLHEPFILDSVEKVNKVFEGLYEWNEDRFLAPVNHGTSVSAGGRSGEVLLNIRHGVPRRRKTHRKQREIKFKPTAYGIDQMNSIRESYNQIMTLTSMDNWEENSLVLHDIRLLGQPLLEDFLSNSVLRQIDRPRSLEVLSKWDISHLHGLHPGEWLQVVNRLIVTEGHLGSLERAFRLTRLLLTRTIFLHDQRSTLLLRLLQIGIASRFSDPRNLLLATRWFFRAFRDLPAATALFLQAVARGTPEAIEGPLLRLITRITESSPSHSPTLLISLLTHLRAAKYDRCLRLVNTYLSALPSNPIILIGCAVVFLHHSSRRTCVNQGELVQNALCLLHKLEHVTDADTAYYNIARGYHFIGYHHYAVYYYRKCLEEVMGVEQGRMSRYRQLVLNNLRILSLIQGEYSLSHKYNQLLSLN